MKHEIQKLNQLKHIDSFMQINYLRGFKYIDKAGEIVNLFFTNQEAPPYQMTQRELIIKETIADPKTYRIAVDNVWCHDSDPQNLGNLEQSFQKKSCEFLGILDVKEITRVGWRNYFIYELQDREEKNRILSKFVPITDSEFSNMRFQKNICDFECNFIIKGAEKRDEGKTQAIIFDIDCFKNFDASPIAPGDVLDCLTNIREVLNSKNMLEVINLVLATKNITELVKQ